MWAILAWSIVLVLCGIIFVRNNFHDEGVAAGSAITVEEANQPLPPGMLDPLGRLVMGMPAEQRAAQLEVIKTFGGGPWGALRGIVLDAETRGKDIAGKTLAKLRAEAPAGTLLAQDADSLKRIYDDGPDSLDPPAAEGLRSRHGYLGRLALTFGKSETDPDRAAVLQEAVDITTKVGLLGGGGLMALGLGVLASITTAIVFLALGRVKPALAPAAPGGSVFLETFAVFMIAMGLVGLLARVLHDKLGSGAIMLQWLVPISLLWPLVRGVRWRNMRYAMGWHAGRGFFWEIGSGILGYLALAPVVVTGILGTFLLAAVRAYAMKEEGPPPSHPIGELLSGADPLLVIAIASLAVVWAPLVEESVFRGALYHHLRGRFHWLLAGPIQAFIFAAVHPQGWIAIPALGSIGLCFSLLREWRSSLIAPMTAHALNNGTIVTILIIIMSL